MGTNCTNCSPLVADLFLFCYERDFMLSLSDDNHSEVIEAFNSTSRYLDDLLILILFREKNLIYKEVIVRKLPNVLSTFGRKREYKLPAVL